MSLRTNRKLLCTVLFTILAYNSVTISAAYAVVSDRITYEDRVCCGLLCTASPRIHAAGTRHTLHKQTVKHYTVNKKVWTLWHVIGRNRYACIASARNDRCAWRLWRCRFVIMSLLTVTFYVRPKVLYLHDIQNIA